jgi:hypothetical protein
MSKKSALLRCALVVTFGALVTCACACACSKTDHTDTDRKVVEYGDAVGIEFGDATSGRFLAAVAAQKGHSPEKGVSALAAALTEASKGCPSLSSEATDPKNAPTLRFLVKSTLLAAAPGAAPETPSASCMTKSMTGKSANLESDAPYELTIQLLAKKAAD